MIWVIFTATLLLCDGWPSPAFGYIRISLSLYQRTGLLLPKENTQLDLPKEKMTSSCPKANNVSARVRIVQHLNMV